MPGGQTAKPEQFMVVPRAMAFHLTTCLRWVACAVLCCYLYSIFFYFYNTIQYLSPPTIPLSVQYNNISGRNSSSTPRGILQMFL
jgi:hypothetical protein